MGVLDFEDEDLRIGPGLGSLGRGRGNAVRIPLLKGIKAHLDGADGQTIRG